MSQAQNPQRDLTPRLLMLKEDLIRSHMIREDEAQTDALICAKYALGPNDRRCWYLSSITPTTGPNQLFVWLQDKAPQHARPASHCIYDEAGSFPTTARACVYGPLSWRWERNSNGNRSMASGAPSITLAKDAAKVLDMQ